MIKCISTYIYKSKLINILIYYTYISDNIHNSDKMTVKTPEFACGQILYSIKESQLNYLVEETPYSVLITLRKNISLEATEKFINTPHIIPSENIIDVKNKLEQVEYYVEEENNRKR